MATRKELMKMLKATSSDHVKMLEFENEIQERRQREEDLRIEMLRKEQEAADDIERDRRHRAWLQQGQLFFDKMLAKEQQELRAKEFREAERRRQSAIEKEEREKRLAKERKKWADDLRQAALEKEETERMTRWYDNGARYIGNYKEEETWSARKNAWCNRHRTPHGFGRFFLEPDGFSGEDKLQYEGEWRLGQMHGRGKFYWRLGKEAGNTYDGEFEYGKKHGFGTYKLKGEAVGRDCVYWKDRRCAWWNELKEEGVRIHIRLHHYNSATEWFGATILRFDPTRVKQRHLIKFDFDSPSPTRWVDLTRQEFKCGIDTRSSVLGGESLPPLSYRLLKPTTETGRYISDIQGEECRKTDALFNRKKFKNTAIRYFLPNVIPKSLQYDAAEEKRGEVDSGNSRLNNKVPYTKVNNNYWMLKVNETQNITYRGGTPPRTKLDEQNMANLLGTDMVDNMTGSPTFALMERLKSRIKRVIEYEQPRWSLTKDSDWSIESKRPSPPLLLRELSSP